MIVLKGILQHVDDTTNMHAQLLADWLYEHLSERGIENVVGYHVNTGRSRNTGYRRTFKVYAKFQHKQNDYMIYTDILENDEPVHEIFNVKVPIEHYEWQLHTPHYSNMDLHNRVTVMLDFPWQKTLPLKQIINYCKIILQQ